MVSARRKWIFCFRSPQIRWREAPRCCSNWSDSRATPDAPQFIPRSWGGLHTPRPKTRHSCRSALRRHAETKARAGDHAEAAKLVEEATTAAKLEAMTSGVRYALPRPGAIALYRADWAEAERALSEARASLPVDFADQEELARLEHNFGVVALYRGHPDKRARRSLVPSRPNGGSATALGFARACSTLASPWRSSVSSIRPTSRLKRRSRSPKRSGKRRGVAGALRPARTWKFAARMRSLRSAGSPKPRRWVRPFRARCEPISRCFVRSASLLEGDGLAALAAVGQIDKSLRESDALVDSRALIAEARAHLALLPVDRKRAARLAVLAIRRSRAGQLPEAEQDAKMALAAARASSKTGATGKRYDERVVVTPIASQDEPAWQWMASVGEGISVADAAFQLARLAVVQFAPSGASSLWSTRTGTPWPHGARTSTASRWPRPINDSPPTR